MSKFLASTALAIVFSTSGFAEGPEDVGTTYMPDDFAQYAPLNARDMVERVPGFRLSNSRGQNESRGFGQATENVLINGQRPSSKSSSAADVLARIPAETVQRIELLDGASLDIPGLSGRVVNVIAQASGITGTWAYRARVIDGREPFPFGGEMSVAGQRENLGWAVNMNLEPRGSSGEGVETVTSASGEPLSSGKLIQNNQFPEQSASLALQWTPPSGVIANLQAEVSAHQRKRRESADVAPVIAPVVRERTLVENEGTTAELSGDIEFDLLGGRLKLIGVYSDSESPFTSERIDSDATNIEQSRSQFRQDTDERERIVRTEYKWAALGGSWDASLELAKNTLDSEAALLTSTGGGALAPVVFDDAAVSVEETRNEGFLTYSHGLREHVQMQVSVGVETSEIQSSGPTGQTRSFTRPKGGVTLSWQYDDNTTLNARIDREVGQLDFFDFVSQRDLDDGEDQVGNSDIVPEQSWRGEIELERQLGAWGAGNVLVFVEALEDIVDQVPIGSGEGPGNIDSGSRFGIEFEGTLNLDPIGLNGAQFTYSALAQESEIDDPLTGLTRAINDDTQLELELEFRHDISGTHLAWGGDVSAEDNADTFRLDSVRSKMDQPGRMSLFVEHKNLWGLTGRAELFRPFNNIEKESRVRYSPSRTGAISELERTRIVDKPVLILELSGVF
jgi:TonB dependent receptor-like, beta-barrel/TonB-dependent Receptor Plug Domain